MRTVMCMAASSVGPHPVVDALTEGPIVRQLLRKPAMAIGFAETMKSGWARGPAGFILPNATVSVDAGRLVRVITKITKGLYYHHMGTALPTARVVRVMLDLPIQEFYELKELLLQCSNIGVRGYPDKVFTYIGARNTENPEVSMWLMTFYHRFTAFAVTIGPKDTHMVFGDFKTGTPIVGLKL